MKPRRFFIYGLFDPREPERIRYVGQSCQPNHRLSHHRSYPITEWGKALKLEGVKLQMRILEVVNSITVSMRERYWVEFYGSDLVNRFLSVNTRTFKMRHKIC